TGAGCRALLAAARGDARGAAAALEMVAADEAELRRWSAVAGGASEQLAFARRWLPWTRVAGAGEIARAGSALDRACARARAVIADVLAGL
ncbi:MAG TPA: hypothetical protein VNI83_07075, partial [Vicinamibacterales bacterium]|nr:hypothetical protein [Vicinamibacterales bacterium]